MSKHYGLAKKYQNHLEYKIFVCKFVYINVMS